MAYLRDILTPVRNVINPIKDLVSSPLVESSPSNFFVRFYVDDRNLLYGLAASMAAVSLWETYLLIRQRRVIITHDKVPSELVKCMDNDKFEKSRQYALDKNLFTLIKGQFDLVVNAATLLLKAHVPIWALSGAMVKLMGLPVDQYEISQTCCYLILTNLMGVILHMPFKLYSTFVVEEKYGFNNQTLSFFIKDEIKKFIVMQMVSLPIFGSIIYIIKTAGPLFPVFAWGFSSVSLLAMMTIYPMYIAPLFDKYTPLPEGELRNDIEALAKRLEYPLTKLFLVDGSKRSAHSNAYLYGFFKNKRIVLFDTLIKGYQPSVDGLSAEEKEKLMEKQKAKGDHGCTNEEIVAILGHELGHWKHSHTVKNLVVIESKIFVFFLLFNKVLSSKSIYQAFGFTNNQPAAVGLFFISGSILIPLKVVMNLLSSSLSRHFEYQADKFAVSLGYSKPLEAALIKLHLDNLSFPCNDELYSMYNFSHPTLIERLRAISEAENIE